MKLQHFASSLAAMATGGKHFGQRSTASACVRAPAACQLRSPLCPSSRTLHLLVSLRHTFKDSSNNLLPLPAAIQILNRGAKTPGSDWRPLFPLPAGPWRRLTRLWEQNSKTHWAAKHKLVQRSWLQEMCGRDFSYPRGNTNPSIHKKISHSLTSSYAQYYFPTADESHLDLFIFLMIHLEKILINTVRCRSASTFTPHDKLDVRHGSRV